MSMEPTVQVWPWYTNRGKRSIYKEHKLYQDEEVGLKRKLDNHIADNAEEWDIKNTVSLPSRLLFLPRVA